MEQNRTHTDQSTRRWRRLVAIAVLILGAGSTAGCALSRASRTCGHAVAQALFALEGRLCYRINA